MFSVAGSLSGRQRCSPLPFHIASPVGVVDLRPPVGRGALHRFRVPEHGGEGRDAHALDGAAQVQFAGHVHRRRAAAMHDEAVGTGHARPVEQGVDHDGVVVDVAFADPEVGEVREFFRVRDAGVLRQPSRRQAELVGLAHAPEVRGADEACPALVLAQGRLVGGLANLEAGEGRRRRRELRERTARRRLEIVGAKQDLARLVPVQGEQADRFWEQLADGQEGDGVRTVLLRGEERAIQVGLDAAFHVVVHRLDDGGIRHGWRDVGLEAASLAMAFTVSKLNGVAGPKLSFASWATAPRSVRERSWTAAAIFTKLRLVSINPAERYRMAPDPRGRVRFAEAFRSSITSFHAWRDLVVDTMTFRARADA